jgi:predicted transcriptional regulator
MTKNEKELKDGLEGERNDVLDRICEEVIRLPKQPNEFTINDVTKRTGENRKAVEYRIKKMEQEGTLTSRKPANERFYKYVEDN